MNNSTGYIKQLYPQGNESPAGSSSALENTGAPWSGGCWGWEVRIETNLETPKPDLRADLGLYRASARLAPGSVFCLREVM